MFYQISDPEVFTWWDRGLGDLGAKDSQCGAPPNGEVREGQVVRRMALAEDSASPVSGYGAGG